MQRAPCEGWSTTLVNPMANHPEGARQRYRVTRSELGSLVPPRAIDAAFRAWRAEGERLAATACAVDLVERPCGVRHSGPGSYVAVSKYSSNFGQRSSHLCLCPLSWGFTARWFALFAGVDRHLPEQRRNRACPAMTHTRGESVCRPGLVRRCL